MLKTTFPNLPLILKPTILALFLCLSFLLFLSLQTPLHRRNLPSSAVSGDDNDLHIRPGYSSYDKYIQRQLNKTLNPKLRQIWTTRDWDRKVHVFSQFFQSLKQRHLISNDSKALSIGARVGQEVAALKRVGVTDSIGLDLVAYPPLVVQGDFHAQPFGNETFDFEFSNVFDHALYPWKFVGEIERTLKGGGVCVLHLSLSKRTDKYSANDLLSVKPLVALFKESKLVEVKNVDGFGLDTELLGVVVLVKEKSQRLCGRFIDVASAARTTCGTTQLALSHLPDNDLDPGDERNQENSYIIRGSRDAWNAHASS
ncbi:hypothetical protein ACFE04_027647 [Oxalis oulophora]